MKTIITMCAVLGILFSHTLYAEEAEETSEKKDTTSAISRNIQNLKNEVLELNRDLFILEEDLLFSANTQVSVFLSVDVDTLFTLDSVQLKLDDKIVSNYLYTDRELKALNQGGVQKLYIGNLTTGEHELTAFFIGQGPSKRNFKRATTKVIDKSDSAKYVELKIVGNNSKEQPDFVVKVWE